VSADRRAGRRQGRSISLSFSFASVPFRNKLECFVLKVLEVN
jgi:hypothetical protein